MTLRRNIITGEPILFAPERAARPRAFGDDSHERCPFCPGHEIDTPPTLVAAGDPWRVRVFPNKYPSVEKAEVIVESPDHDAAFDAIEHAEDAVRMYVDRYGVHHGAAYTAVFKNQGTRAGASIAHVHSQVMPVPFVPPRIARESESFIATTTCPLCTPEGALIRESEHFLWLAPAGSSFAYQQWLVPRRHLAEMSGFHDAELTDLASMLRIASRAMRTLGDSYNWSFVNFPRTEAAHCYVDLVPRLTSIAGFELGTGTFVEIVDPAAAARRLRSE